MKKLEIYIDDFQNDRVEIRELITNCNSFNKIEKLFTTEILEECC